MSFSTFRRTNPGTNELDHLLRRRHRLEDARAVLRDLTGPGFEHPHLDGDALRACLEIDLAHADLDLGLTDASLVILAERYRTLDVLTLDQRHFAVVRPRQGGAFRLPLLDDWG